MAVKPSAGEVIEETKRTRIVPQEPEKDQRTSLMPLWDYVESVPAGDWTNGEYEFTIYRGRSSQKAEEKTWIGKFHEKISPDIIQSRWGGGEYNVWLKCPPGFQLRYNKDLKIEGPPRISSEPVNSGPTAMDATSQLIAMFREEMRAMRDEMKMARGGDLGMEAVKQALTLNGQVFSSAAASAVGTLQHIANPGGNTAPATDPMRDMMMTFMQASISKMMNPSDPIEAFAKMAGAMSNLGFKMGGNPNGGIAAELARGLMNALPQLAAHVGSIMDQYRRAEEAKLHQVAMTRGLQPPITVAAAPQPAAPTNVIEMPAAAPQESGGMMSSEQGTSAEQLFQYVEAKVVELLMNLDLTPEEAANDALTFIDITDKNLVDELIRHGDSGLLWAFTNRPTLQRVPQGPRLDAFIAEFVKNGRKVAVPIPLAPDPNIPPA